MWIFFIFWPGKIHISPTDVVSFLSPPRCHLSSDRRRHTAAPCHASFSLSQDKFVISTSSFGNTLSCRLPSRDKTEAMYSHHHRRLSSLNHPTPTIHCYKKIISIFVTLPITQPHLYFTSSLARVPRHGGSTCRRRSLLPLSYVHHPST
jgi:hypothetical protein